jgi:peptidoglycan/LPS O-acetylase OafA/YrhL
MAKKEFNSNLEGLRGFAAIGVMVGHIFLHDTYFDKRYCPTVFKSLVPFAHIEVLIFFVLSGFVIGTNHPSRMRGEGIKEYLKKRLLRIYPIYLIGMLIALTVACFQYGAGTIATNLTLTQNIFTPVIWEIGPAWSINYEILYYLLFIPISFFEIRPEIAFVFSLAIGALNMYVPTSPLISAYFIGFSFWLLGLIIAKKLRGEHQVRFLPFLFYILAIENLFATLKISPLINRILPIPDKSGYWYQTIVNINDLIFMPYCFMILLYFSGRSFKGRNLLFIIMSLIPLRIMINGLRNHNRDNVFVMGAIYFGLFLLTLGIPYLNNAVKKSLVYIGGISYALYILHFPLECLFGHITILSSPEANYWVKLALYLPIVAVLSWVLEKRLQPFLKQKLMIKKPINDESRLDMPFGGNV